MFKLVGDETFTINKFVCVVKIEPCGLFNYSYTLIVDGKSLHTFSETRSKICCTWLVCLPPDGIFRVVLRTYKLLIIIQRQTSIKSGEASNHFRHFIFKNSTKYILYLRERHVGRLVKWRTNRS